MITSTIKRDTELDLLQLLRARAGNQCQHSIRLLQFFQHTPDLPDPQSTGHQRTIAIGEIIAHNVEDVFGKIDRRPVPSAGSVSTDKVINRSLAAKVTVTGCMISAKF
jgi:hypothetical protein